MSPSLSAAALARIYAAQPQVEAVALAGSGPDVADSFSDLDLYVYSDRPLSLNVRRSLVPSSAVDRRLGYDLWERGDEWVDPASGLKVDVTFRTLDWTERALDEVLVHHRAALGYTTAIWHNLRSSISLFDRSGWFRTLQTRTAVPMPPALRRHILSRNLSALSGVHSSYMNGLRAGVARGDLIAVNHRTSAMLASLFDLLFALNGQLHPGEKRLLRYVEATCPVRPVDLTERVGKLIEAAGAADPQAVELAQSLVDDLQRLCRADAMELVSGALTPPPIS